jgi:teichuronic acid exporter
LSNLKQKTFKGLGWSFLDSFAGSGITFFTGIVLARILSPEIFGVIGMVAFVFALSKTFIDSGFSMGLIRKLSCSNEDYNTVFVFNLLMSFLLYVIIFFAAPWIATFFKVSELIEIIRVLSLIIVMDAISIVQRVILTREINFKLQTKISLLSSLLSGLIALILALKGYGVWSLVYQMLSKELINGVFLWILSKWRPNFKFSISVFKDLFPFSSKMLGSGLITTLTNNIYYLVIGRYFSASVLGFYTRSEQFNAIVVNNLTGTLERVFFPVLASLQGDDNYLKTNFKKVFRTSFFISFLALMVLAVIAKPLILLLIGAKWEESIFYLQLLAIGSIFFPINALNLNILKIKGRSDLILKLQVIKTIFLIPIILVGIFFGISWMLIVRLFTTLIATYINSIYSGILINYPFREQLSDIYPYFKAEIPIILGMVLILFFPLSNVFIIIIQIFVGCILFFFIFEKAQFPEYISIKKLLGKKINNKTN